MPTYKGRVESSYSAVDIQPFEISSDAILSREEIVKLAANLAEPPEGVTVTLHEMYTLEDEEDLESVKVIFDETSDIPED